MKESNMFDHLNNSLGYTARLSVILLCLSPLTAAYAEKADSQKETHIEAEHSTIDGKKNIALDGEVTLTRGTLTVRAERATVAENVDGSKYIVLFSGAGKRANFRVKRDGGSDLWVEGEADRIEYDEKTELVKFIAKAKVRYLENKKVTQEQEGEFLSYDSLNDVFVATNTASGKHVPGAGRVKLTLQPKTEKQTN